jgi:hypothetical protein
MESNNVELWIGRDEGCGGSLFKIPSRHLTRKIEENHCNFTVSRKDSDQGHHTERESAPLILRQHAAHRTAASTGTNTLLVSRLNTSRSSSEGQTHTFIRIILFLPEAEYRLSFSWHQLIRRLERKARTTIKIHIGTHNFLQLSTLLRALYDKTVAGVVKLSLVSCFALPPSKQNTVLTDTFLRLQRLLRRTHTLKQT